MTDLRTYIEEQRRKGVKRAEIRAALLQRGWQPELVDPYLKRSYRAWWIAGTVLVVALTLLAFHLHTQPPEIVTEPPAYEEDAELLNRALVERDMGLCQRIGSEAVRADCTSAFTPQECDAGCRDMETFNTALAWNNATLCSSITDEGIRSQCEDAMEARRA